MTVLENQFVGWRFQVSCWADALRRQWQWMLLCLAAFALVGFFCGYQAGFYTATIELLDCALANGASARERIDAGVGQVQRDLVAGLARSDYVLQRVAGASEYSSPPESLAALTDVSVTPAAGLIALKVKDRDASQTVRLANVFGEQVAAAAQALLGEGHRATQQQIARKLNSVDEDLRRVSLELIDFQKRTTGMEFEGEWAAPIRRMAELDRKSEDIRGQLDVCDLQIQSLTREISRLTPALVAAKEALTKALMRYTEEHSKVKELRATIASLEAQSAAPGVAEDPGIGVLNGPAALSLYTRVTELKGQRAGLVLSLEALILQRHRLQVQIITLPENQTEYVRLKSSFEALKDQRFVLARRAQEAQLAEGADTGRIKVIERATHESLSRSHKLTTGLRWGAVSAIIGFFLAAVLLFTLPVVATRIRSGHELMRATGLPLLATLGDVTNMTEEERRQWAFQTFTLIRNKLTRSQEDSLVCGFTSVSHSEGRSTWINLLADAAGRLGYKVVTISVVGSNQSAGIRADTEAGGCKLEVQEPRPLPEGTQVMLLQSNQRQAASLPATWAWSPEYRNQWGQAVQEWQTMNRLLVLVELPPASMPEAVLLAEGLPNLIWLCRENTARDSETRLHLDTFKNARTNVVGCVLNRKDAGGRKRRFKRWLAACGSVLALIAAQAIAQQTEQVVAPPSPAAGNSNAVLSISAPDRLADWQKRLTLGPGDVFDVSLYEQPDSSRGGLSIGPDGRINYLEARDVMAAGLTVDELRTKLEEILGKFHRGPRVVIHPTAYTSKKYYILGSVNQKGVFPLDRPVSIIEAIAKARGFVATFPLRKEWIQADFSRSFLIRRGADGVFGMVPVDFEGLFLRGELWQNFSMEPDDYLFFPPLDLQEVYVLGEVRGPGIIPYSPDVTAFGVIIARGGFTERAFKSRVLIVRGSLNHPQTFVLNAGDILTGKGLDFPLNNRDIVYVHRKPWAKAQELLEQSVTAFVNAFVVSYAGLHIGPFIKEPLIK